MCDNKLRQNLLRDQRHDAKCNETETDTQTCRTNFGEAEQNETKLMNSRWISCEGKYEGGENNTDVFCCVRLQPRLHNGNTSNFLGKGVVERWFLGIPKHWRISSPISRLESDFWAYTEQWQHCRNGLTIFDTKKSTAEKILSDLTDAPQWTLVQVPISSECPCGSLQGCTSTRSHSCAKCVGGGLETRSWGRSCLLGVIHDEMFHGWEMQLAYGTC